VKAGATVQAILTEAGASFVGPATFEGLTGRPAFTTIWGHPERILHIRLAREADVAVFAPATANLLAKFAAGIADDLLTSTYTALTCPVVVAPAMHTEMWEHPPTRRAAAVLEADGVRFVGPDEGPLAGGDAGPGRLAEVEAIGAAVIAALTPNARLDGRRVVVTAGGTREPLDPVRYLGNRSSGKMGYAVAAEAARRGAVVDLISTATATLTAPHGVTVTAVETALQMRDAVLGLADDADVIVKAAAVADFRPAAYAPLKIKKDSDALRSVALVRNPDILAELGGRPHRAVLVGFAAETDLEEEHGREKLHRKGADLIVVNRVDATDAGFAVDTNRAVILGRDGSRREVPLTTKLQLAAVILNEAQRLLETRGPATHTP
jgi:phosphopantothenoylcysteine decarboxylase/phosphopantothenate--cysteine ligase